MATEYLFAELSYWEGPSSSGSTFWSDTRGIGNFTEPEIFLEMSILFPESPCNCTAKKGNDSQIESNHNIQKKTTENNGIAGNPM